MDRAELDRMNREVFRRLDVACSALPGQIEDLWEQLAADGEADERGGAEWRRVLESLASALGSAAVIRAWLVAKINERK